MTWFVWAAWGLAVLGFGALALGAATRHAAAKRRLLALDPRGGA